MEKVRERGSVGPAASRCFGMEPRCPGWAVSRGCPRCSKACLIYSSELGAAPAKCLQERLVPRRFLTSWVKWPVCRVAVVVSRTAKCGVRSHRCVFPVYGKKIRLYLLLLVLLPVQNLTSLHLWVVFVLNQSVLQFALCAKEKNIYPPPPLHFHYIFAPFWWFFCRYQSQLIQLNYFAASFSQGGGHWTHCVLWHYHSQIGQEMKDCQNVTVYFLAWKHTCFKYDM